MVDGVGGGGGGGDDGRGGGGGDVRGTPAGTGSIRVERLGALQPVRDSLQSLTSVVAALFNVW